jgi:hypothetical protein
MEDLEKKHEQLARLIKIQILELLTKIDGIDETSVQTSLDNFKKTCKSFERKLDLMEAKLEAAETDHELKN